MDSSRLKQMASSFVVFRDRCLLSVFSACLVPFKRTNQIMASMFGARGSCGVCKEDDPCYVFVNNKRDNENKPAPVTSGSDECECGHKWRAHHDPSGSTSSSDPSLLSCLAPAFPLFGRCDLSATLALLPGVVSFSCLIPFCPF
jgi:hypothetical protein